ncbi:MAG: hypothetical protein WBC63_06060 [Candidatus Bipolaricaulia bacterium]
MKKPEPDRLRRGKAVHDQIQQEWEAEAQGDVTREKGVTKPSGSRGRIDIHVQADEGLAAVVEVKNSDWDAMSPKAVQRNAKRYARQIWSYIEAELEEGNEVSPGITFPKRPETAGRLEEIEKLFDDEGIPVVWQDEGN